tara:strand:+ start:167 stop:496 length:330 start_codon:yes stop_codon:yes gene_type:complete
MDKITKTDFIIEGISSQIRKKPSPKLFNQVIGLKFKSLRLKTNRTAEAVVQDNKIYFKSIFDLYKFEKGIKVEASKLWCLSNYYSFDLPEFLNKVTTRKGTNDKRKTKI